MTASARTKDNEPTVIKKYANRRLYDTGRSSYVTLDDLCAMVKEGHEFVVYDAKSGEDLTRQVLTQIIVDQEGKGENMLPIPFLRQLIGFYGDNLQSLVPNYLEQTFGMFTKNQEMFRDQIGKSLGGMMNPATAMEDITRQNMAMFENAMRAWSPFQMGQTNVGGSSAKEDTQQKANELRKNIEEMQKELARLSGQ